MTHQTLRILYLLIYLFIASQGMFYLLGINRALLNISIPAFVEQRKSIDAVIGNPLRFLYCSAVAIGLSILCYTYKRPESFIFLSVALSLICILVDMMLAIRKSIPLNKLINAYPTNHDMETIRKEWVTWISIRGAIAIAGLFILLSGFVVTIFNIHGIGK